MRRLRKEGDRKEEEDNGKEGTLGKGEKKEAFKRMTGKTKKNDGENKEE